MIVSDERVRTFVEIKTGHQFHLPYSLVGLECDGRIVAGAVFTGWTGPDVDVSLAAERGRMSRKFLRALKRYVVDQLGCIRCTAATEQPEVIRIAERMGGRVEGIKRDGYGPGRDATIVGVLAKDWRF